MSTYCQHGVQTNCHSHSHTLSVSHFSFSLAYAHSVSLIYISLSHTHSLSHICFSPTHTRPLYRSLSLSLLFSLLIGDNEMNARAYCSLFGFKGADQQKKVGALSGKITLKSYLSFLR